MGVVAVVVVYYLGFYFVCSSYVAPRENFRAKAQESICRRKVLSEFHQNP